MPQKCFLNYCINMDYGTGNGKSTNNQMLLGLSTTNCTCLGIVNNLRFVIQN